MSFKFTVELCVMTMKNDIKIEEELICRFKSDMNLSYIQNLTRALEKPKKKTFIGFL